MQGLKEAITELTTSYDKITDLLGPKHPLSKEVLSIIKRRNPENTHQIVSDQMGQKKVQSELRGLGVVAGKKSKTKNK